MKVAKWAAILLFISQTASAEKVQTPETGSPEPSAPPSNDHEKGPIPSAPPAYDNQVPPVYHAQLVEECQKTQEAAYEIELFPGARDGDHGSNGDRFGFQIFGTTGTSADDQSVDTPSDGRALHVQAQGAPGQMGANGADGKDAVRAQLPDNISHHRQNYRAGNGGNGGNGGTGGKGGDGGNLTVFYRKADKSDIGTIVADLSGGPGGKGGKGGRGGRADDTEDRWTYECQEHGILEDHSIRPGKSGRDGWDGPDGRRGAIGQLTIVPMAWKSEYLRGTLKRKQAERPVVVDDYVTLRDVRVYTRTGAADLLGHGSVVQDGYNDVEVREVSASIHWQVAERKLASLSNHSVTYTITTSRQVKAALAGYLIRQEYDASSQRLYIKDIVAEDAVVGFKVDQIEGELATLNVTITDERSDEFRDLDIHYTVDVQVVGYLGFVSVLGSPVAVPANLIERSGDRVTIRLGEWIDRHQPKSLWRLHRGGAYVDKHVRVRVSAKTFLARGFDQHAEVTRRIDDKIEADPSQDDQQMPWSGRVFEWLCPVSWI